MRFILKNLFPLNGLPRKFHSNFVAKVPCSRMYSHTSTMEKYLQITCISFSFDLPSGKKVADWLTALEIPSKLIRIDYSLGSANFLFSMVNYNRFYTFIQSNDLKHF